MCGIVGMLTSGLDRSDVAEVEALARLMDVRGPDDRGAWTDGKACALGFRRLAVIDLSDRAHQPMVSDNGEHVLVYNGEVYNFASLRAELVTEGVRFHSSSDTEVVLMALVQWGTAALARFNGMFALAWYQVRTQTLVLARDPLGIKPLNYWQANNATVFGSNYDQVIRHRRAAAHRVDREAAHLYLRLGYLPGPYGLIENTGQIRPGHFAELRPGGELRQRVFRLPAEPVAPEFRLNDAEARDAVAETVAGSVARQMVSDVEVGCFLSGGVDSPLVAASMRASSSEPIRSFTVGTEDAASDESSVAAAYAERLGLRHELRQITGTSALDLLDDVATAYPEPFGDYSSLPTLLVSALAAEQVKVVMSGDGGDELFWGYPRFAKFRKARPWFHIPHPMRVSGYGATKPFPVHRRPARGVMFPSIGAWFLDAHSGFHGNDLELLAPGLGPMPADFELFHYDHVGSDDDLAQWMRRNELSCHLPMILNKVDRASMFHSLEVRVPLLDLELVDLSARIGPESCTSPPRSGGRGAVGKAVLRAALERHVPAEQIPVAKRGFTVPLGQWLRDDLRPVVEALLLERDPYPEGVFDRTALSKYYRDHREGRRVHTRGLWNLLALQLWADKHRGQVLT